MMRSDLTVVSTSVLGRHATKCGSHEKELAVAQTWRRMYRAVMRA